MEKWYRWHGWDDPNLVNEATVTFTPSGLLAHGVQSSPRYSAEWSLDAAQGWITRELRVHVKAEGWGRTLDLRRSPAGRWSLLAETYGTQPPDLDEPGISTSTDLDQALDCDLGLCPLTNTMPIRRLGLQSAQGEPSRMIMAWVDMPSLRVAPSPQGYAPETLGSVRYSSGASGRSWLLTIDADGVVVDYPGLAHRVE